MRRIYLTHPRFQYSFTFSFVMGVIVILLVLGGAAVGSLHLLARENWLDPSQQQAILASVKSLTRWLSVISVPVISLFFFIGFYLSYKFVGPLYRVEAWLEMHLLGQDPGPLKLRPGDELRPLVKALGKTILKFKSKKGKS